MHQPKQHPSVAYGRVGVLLVNLGTPDDLSVRSVRRYLREFLSDSRVVEIPKPIWWLILNGIVLNTRPKKSVAAYAKIWRHDDQESPLRYFTRAQSEKLATHWPELVVDFAMRYGNPDIASRLDAMRAAGCDRLLVVPLYPQYSATTNASVNDAVFDHLKTLRWQPTVRIAHPWYDQPAYIDALVQQVHAHLGSANPAPDKILLSFHGLPKRSLELGDPYYCHCQKTGRLLAEALGWPHDKVLITFQSRFGPAKWLEPYTSDTLADLPGEGVKNLLVLTPGFATDCLETLEEIAMEGVETFKAAGGENCTVLPCLNDSEEGMQVLNDMVTRELAGWLAT
ncbi:ferrochelatase [Reinekea blandensis]|uniref:Ferrochelatase n=1 Tax=Reinekea blandensis MED297 TaxID=314283 RepID=A4BAF4_9GAMM|nr:ferrochelatase [Reinekea blandensis]EAR10910.1 ferrochelatase [Reinekea sp. MED297] [Reinekea blandensis MED297]